MDLGDEKYVAVTTFRASGAEVSTPVWIVALDGGRLGFRTGSGSGKVKRLGRDPRVMLQPSDARGRPKPGSIRTAGKAEMVPSGPEFDTIDRKIRAKYGVLVPVLRAINKFRMGRSGSPDVCVVISVD